jgi:Fur family zinc uptake transcriptional regulator
MVRGFEPHDHVSCIADAMATAEKHCTKQKLRLTDVRRQVLEILLREHVALGAYDLLEHLRQAGFKSQPPVAYRALDFLVTHGFAHKVEKLNAFIACSYPGKSHSPAFMICRNCDVVAETCSTPMKGSLGAAARTAGFKIERTVVEVEGLCPACQDCAN